MPKKSLSRILLVPERWPPRRQSPTCAFAPTQIGRLAGPSPTSPFYVFHIFRRRRRRDASDKSTPRRASEGHRVASFKFKRCPARTTRTRSRACMQQPLLRPRVCPVRYDVGVGLVWAGHPNKCLSFLSPTMTSSCSHTFCGSGQKSIRARINLGPNERGVPVALPANKATTMLLWKHSQRL